LIFVRSLLFTAYFYLLSTASVLGAVPTALFGPRRALIGWMAFWNRATLAGLAAICGVRVEIRGREHLPTGGALIAGKHQCMLDAFAPFSYLPDPTLVMKKELMWIPFMGWYSTLSGMIVIDRGGHSTALRKMMDDGRQLVIFPEGHRQDPGAPPDYKPGIAALYRDLAIPCIPVATNSGVHWPAHGFLRKPGVVVYEYLEPIPAGLKRAAFMAELERRIETASNALLAAGI